MKRDRELIRQLLLWIEEHGPARSSQDVQIAGRSRAEVMFHLKFLRDDGNIRAIDASTHDDDPALIPLSLTSRGYDLLDQMRESAANCESAPDESVAAAEAQTAQTNEPRDPEIDRLLQIESLELQQAIIPLREQRDAELKQMQSEFFARGWDLSGGPGIRRSREINVAYQKRVTEAQVRFAANLGMIIRRC